MGKTETIKQRAVWIYLPSIEMKNNWEKLSEKQGMSFSRWIIENVEENLVNRSEKGKSRRTLEQENNDLKEELANIQKKLKDVTIIKEILEKDIRKYRASPFLDSGDNRVRNFDKDIISLLRNAIGTNNKHRFLGNNEILSRLNVKVTDAEVIKSISNQLSRLEKYGLLESGSKGWRWKND